MGSAFSDCRKRKTTILVLNKTNPTSHPAERRTEPYVIACCDAYFDGKMWTNAVRFSIFFLEIFVKFDQHSLGILVRDSPFCGILWVLRDKINFEKGRGSRDIREYRD